MKIKEVTVYESRTYRILNESYQTLTEAQQNYLLESERESRNQLKINVKKLNKK